jgi:hypothetical protein
MPQIIKRAIGDRLKGDRPSAVRAFFAAVVAGVMVAVITYRLLRA